MSPTNEQFRQWLPQYWPTWIGAGLFRLLNRMPWSVQRAFARSLGWFAWHFVPIRRRVALINLRLCFPEKSEREIRALARAHFDALVMGLIESCAAWWTDAADLPPHRINGREHFDAAVARGRGAVLLTAHFTTLEICGRYMNEAFTLGCLYRNPNNPVIARLMRGQRERRMAIAVHFDDLKGLIRALRAGHAIWYAPDQGRRTKQSELLPFFGVPAITTTATSKLAAITGSPVVPYFGRREPDGSYTLTILPPLEDFPTSDPSADAVRINRLIEENVRLAPEQYFWVHRRFKGRGPDHPDVYAL
jgi:KDO2-lipid IV(A) lauroyltransferase